MLRLEILGAELGLLAACLGLGAFAMRRIGVDDRELGLAVVIGLGLSLLGMLGLLVVLVGGALVPRRVPLLLIALTVAGGAMAVAQARLIAAQPRLLAAVVATVAAFSMRDWIFFTNDSFYLHYVAEVAIDRGRLPLEDYGWHFLGHPIWLHVAQIWANALGEPYVRWVFPVAYLLTGWVAFVAIRGASGGRGLLVGLAAPALLLLSYQMVIQGQMANHHMMVAMILLVSAVLLIRNDTMAAAVAAGSMLAAIPLMRMEGAMLVGLFAIGMLRVLGRPTRSLAVAGLPLVVATPWVLFLADMRVDGMLSTIQLLLNVAALAAAAFAVTALLALSANGPVAPLLPRWHAACGLLALGLIAAGALIGPATTASNLLIVPQNMLVFARWGLFWDLALIVVIALVAQRLLRQPLAEGPYASLAAVGGLVIGMIFLVGAMRHPYRYNWSDSATRMLVHVAPLVAVWLGERLVALQRQVRGRDAEVEDAGVARRAASQVQG